MRATSRTGLGARAGLALMAPVVAACGSQSGAPTTAPTTDPLTQGCSHVDEAIPESDAHTPFESRRGRYDSEIRAVPPDSPQARQISPPADIAGLPLAGLDETASARTYVAYYATRPADGLTISELYRHGGLTLLVSRRDGAPPGYREVVRIALPERIIDITVGDYAGILTWGDPVDEHGTRPHGVHWSDPDRNYYLAAVLPNHELLNAARTLVCDSSR